MRLIGRKWLKPCRKIGLVDQLARKLNLRLVVKIPRLQFLQLVLTRYLARRM